MDVFVEVNTLLEVLVACGVVNLCKIVYYWYTGDYSEVRMLPVVWGVWSFVLLVWRLDA